MRRILFNCVLILLIIPACVLSQTVIPAGPVSGTWTSAGSPYLIEGEITVPSTESLIIEAGVDVIFQGHYKFIIHGILQALGTAEDTITFTAANPERGWHGLRFIDADDVGIFEYCHITKGRAKGRDDDRNGGGIFCQASDLCIRHSLIDYCGAEYAGGAIYIIGSQSVELTDTRISKNAALSGGGGGIWCALEELTVYNCIIAGNYTGYTGGGIAGSGGEFTFDHCYIFNNLADFMGGGLYFSFCYNPNIENSEITGNQSFSSGGGICAVNGCSPTITHSIIERNISSPHFAGGGGGGIYLENNFLSTIEYTSIRGNRSVYGGGGIYLEDSDVNLVGCDISANMLDDAGSDGGALIADGCLLDLDKCTIAGNQSMATGGGFCLHDSQIMVWNSIIWANLPEQISNSSSLVTIWWSDVEGDWSGLGNIDADPQFVLPESHDYRLQWGSPCIDAGDYDPDRNDPDGTRADMGAHFYDQANSIRVLLCPHTLSPQVPSTGADIHYTITVSNSAFSVQMITYWTEMVYPDGTISDPLTGPTTIPVFSSQQETLQFSHSFAATDPAGIYTYCAYAVTATDTSSDTFTIIKLGMAEFELTSPGPEWWKDIFQSEPPQLPVDPGIMQNAPNPFNPSTVVSFRLQVASRVNLAVYDIAGRRVTQLVDGWRDAGVHKAVFDAQGLAAGVYLYHLQAGEQTATGKMVLIK